MNSPSLTVTVERLLDGGGANLDHSALIKVIEKS